MQKQYWLADDCPNCGDKDSDGAWRGARVFNTEWGHDYSCCSEKCGLEFATSRKRKELERENLKKHISLMKAQLKNLERQLK